MEKLTITLEQIFLTLGQNNYGNKIPILMLGFFCNIFQAMMDPTFWFTCLLSTVVLLLPVIAWRFYRSDVHPTLADKVRLLQRHSKIKPKEEFRPFSGRRSR